MRGYGIAMTVHELGIIALFAGFAMQHRAGSRLRRATTSEAARPWAELLAGTRSMVPSGALMLLLSGGYLATSFGSSPPVWVVVAAVAMLLIGVAGLVFGQRFAALNRAVTIGSGALNVSDVRQIASPGTWALHAAANGAALGIIWLMAAKPVGLEAVLVVGVAALIGATAGTQVARRAQQLAHATS